MKKIKISLTDKETLKYKLKIKYLTINDLPVQNIDVFQIKHIDHLIVTIIAFYYGFLKTKCIEFRYSNKDLFMVSGDEVEMKFIDEMKNLLKEFRK